MKTKKLKIFFKWLGNAFFLLAFLASMSFAWNADGLKKTRSLEFKINNTNGNVFLQESQLRDFIGISETGWQNRLKNNFITQLEQKLSQHPSVYHCKVFTSLSGKITIEAQSKTPLMRITDLNSHSLYIDFEGGSMPLSDLWTARLPLVSGYFKANDFKVVRKPVSKPTLKTFNAFEFCRHTLTDTLFKHLIHGIYFDSTGTVILTPVMGPEQIIMDTSEYYPQKLNQLKQFYKTAYRTSSQWNCYQILDLRYSNQIIAIPYKPFKTKTDSIAHE